jgi:two-component system, OmpR family, sensor histidine kinase MtrB
MIDLAATWGSVRRWLTRMARQATRWWRRSLFLRVTMSTLVISLIVVIVVGALLIGRITSGLLDAKVNASLVESSSGFTEAQNIVEQDQTAGDPSTADVVEQVMASLAARAGAPGQYEILLLASPTVGSSANLPERGTNFVAEASVTQALRNTVVEQQRQSWQYAPIKYVNAAPSVAGIVVGAPLSIYNNAYELYYLFPLTSEEQTLSLVTRAIAVAGLVLVLLVVGVAWLVTRQVVTPVRLAARIAERFSAGRLDERMKVQGEDDLARLAMSFNTMAANLKGQIRQLEDLSRLQRRFTSDVSHELRTPLTTVRMAGDVLYEARPDFDPMTARAAELLHDQLDRFEALLTDLLEISRFDAGAAVLEAEPVDLRTLVTACIEDAQPFADRRGCAVVPHLPVEACVAEVDQRRIHRIVRNLLINAIEHSEGQPVDVHVITDDVAVAVGVRDHGVGLRPGESSLVFNRFWRADPARARTTGGTGLGLAIAYEDARLHGGWLEAWGAPGDGAQFRLTVPRLAGGHLLGSPLPLEPRDAELKRRVPLSVGIPYRTIASTRPDPDSAALVPGSNDD